MNIRIYFMFAFVSMHLIVEAQLGCINTTAQITSITSNTAVSGGNICSSSLGLITSRGICWSTSPSPVPGQNGTTSLKSGSGTGSFTVTMTGLSSFTRYYVRSFALSGQVYTYGNELSFVTTGIEVFEALPLTINLTTGTITSLNCSFFDENSSRNATTHKGKLTAGTAASGVSSLVPYTGGNGGTYSGQTIASTGVTGLTATLLAGTFAVGGGNLLYTITGTPSSNGTANFAINIAGKNCSLTRHVCANNCAINVHNTNLNYGTKTDLDGNVYKTIQIGTQTWMAENLKARRYRNGDVIPVVTDPTNWGTLTSGATCWYKNDSAAFNCPYGKLYNGYAIKDPRGLCPVGWHVPSNNEWASLITYLGGGTSPGNPGFGVAGGKMKSTHFWRPSNLPISSATNSSGFSWLPLGSADCNLGESSAFWTSTEVLNNNLYYYFANSLTNDLIGNYRSKNSALPVRCIKD